MAALIDDDHETPGAEGGALPFDISQWLKDNNLSDYSEEFIKQQVVIEELLSLNEDDLREEATHFGITRPIHKNRFVKAVQDLIQSSQNLNPNHVQNNENNKPKNITITKEESECLDQIKSQIKKMRDLLIHNDHISQNLNIMSTKCQNDIKHLFDGLMNSLHSRQTELTTKTQQLSKSQILMIAQHQSNIKEYINAMKQFQTDWSQTMIHQNDEPGQGIEQRKQTVVSKTNALLQRESTIDLKLENKIHIAFVLKTKNRDTIDKSIAKIGCVYSNDVPNPPIMVVLKKSITDSAVQVKINFTNNNEHTLPDIYSVEVAEAKDMSQDQEEEKKGEMDTEMKVDWTQVVGNVRIDPNAIKKTQVEVKDLECNTMYVLQCRCSNKYGLSPWCEYVSFRTKEKIFRIDSIILTEGEKQMLCQKVLCEQLGRGKEGVALQLLFRASTDGFNASEFHASADGKKKTIVIVESTQGNVFGGYTKIAWSKDGKYHNDGSCLLFVCRNVNRKGKNKGFEIYPVKQSLQSKAVKHYEGHGPCFGQGHDLLIVNASNKTDSRSHGESFVNLKGDQLTGSKTQIDHRYWHFMVKDYEVFQIL